MLFIIIICVIIVLIWLQGILFRHYWNDRLSVTLDVKHKVCEAGDANVLYEVITNGKWMPLPMLHVKFCTPKSFHFENEEHSSVSDYYYRDDVFSIMGNQCIKRQLAFTCTERGCFVLQDTSLTSTDLLMNLILTEHQQNSVVIHVYPKKVSTDFFDIPFQTITGTAVTPYHLMEDPFEFRGIREYQRYDSMKSINWKRSAKNQELQVNTYFMTASQEVRILLNLETHIYFKDKRFIEAAISLASSLAERFINAGIPVAIDTNAYDLYTKEPLCRASGSGAGHMVSIDTALARIDANGELENFSELLLSIAEQASPRTYYILISNNRHQEIQDSFLRLQAISPYSYLIVPELKTCQTDIFHPNVSFWHIP